MARTIQAELALEARAELAEGPVWDDRAGCLWWVDIMRGEVHRFDPTTGEDRSRQIGQPVGAAVPSRAGDLVLAVRDGFARLDFSTGRVTPIARVDHSKPECRMNDGKCDRAGRFWAGTMAIDETPGAGALYRLDASGCAHVVLRGVTISNGLDWSLDDRVMYYIDSPTGRVDCFDFDAASGTLANRRPFVTIPSGQGIPDGLTVDADGFVWTALWGGGAVHRYASDGSLDTVVRVPASRTTSCAFGGNDCRELFITTSVMELSPAERGAEPDAGALFRCRPGPAGVAATFCGI